MRTEKRNVFMKKWKKKKWNKKVNLNFKQLSRVSKLNVFFSSRKKIFIKTKPQNFIFGKKNNVKNKFLLKNKNLQLKTKIKKKFFKKHHQNTLRRSNSFKK